MRDLLQRFWDELDSERVGILQAVAGVYFIIAGVNGIFLADQQPPMTLQHAMSHTTVAIWYWLNILGPVICLIGKVLHGKLTYAGMVMQLGGDLVICLFLLSYITGTVRVEPIGHGGYGSYLAEAAFTVGLLLILRDVRRLRKVERLR